MKPLFTLALLALPAFAAFPNGYSYCKVVTTQHTMVSGTNDLTNYPLTVILTDADLKTTGNGGLVNNANGYDIGFYPDCSGSGTALKWEMESYSPTTGAIVAHVLRPLLSHTANDTIGIYYGGSFSTFQSTASAVWDDNYNSVWHLPDGTTLGLNDSTSNGRTLTNNNAAMAVTGQVDGGVNLVASSSQKLSTTNVPSSATMSYTVWAEFNSLPQPYNTVLSVNGSSAAVDLHVKSNGKLAIYVNADSGFTSYDGTGANTLSSGTWYQLGLTYSSAAGLTGYVNGVPDGTAVAQGSITSLGALFEVGNNNPFTPRYWNGIIDEVRVSSIARSADWILTEYRNQSAPGTYISAGPRIGGAARVRHVVTGGV